MKVIKVRNVHKSYGRIHALNGVSFETSQGLIACFGLNGSGKTTLVKLMSGVMRPDRGEFEILGKKVRKNRLPSGISVAFEKVLLPPYFRGEDFLKRICELRDINEVEIKKVVKALKIDDIIHKKIGTLSQGNQKRVAISQAFLGEPDVIILDDPFANLDIHYTVFLENYITKYVREYSSTVFLTTHYLTNLEPTEFIIISQGKLVAHKNLEELDLGKPLRYHLTMGGKKIIVEKFSELKKELMSGAEIEKVDVYTYSDWIKELSL